MGFKIFELMKSFLLFYSTHYLVSEYIIYVLFLLQLYTNSETCFCVNECKIPPLTITYFILSNSSQFQWKTFCLILQNLDVVR